MEVSRVALQAWRRLFIRRNRRTLWLFLGGFWFALVIGSGELAARSQMASLSQALDASLEVQSLVLRGVTQRFKQIPYTSGLRDDVSILLRNPDDAELTRRVDIYLSNLSRRLDAEALYLMNERGRCIAASNWYQPGSFKGDDYSFRTYFQQALGGELGFDYAVGTTSCTPGLYYAAPVKMGDSVFGVMAIKVTLNEIAQSWALSGDPLFLLDRHGIVILSSRERYLYTATRALDAGELRDMQAAGTYGWGHCASDTTFTPTPWSLEQAGASAYQEMVSSPDGRATRFLLKKQYLPEFEWTLVATANMAPVAYARWIAMTIACLILLVLTLGGLYWRQREKRLAALRRASVELERRVEDRTRDLAERDAFRKAMEDALLVGMRARDRDGRITYVNPALCDITGYSAAEMLGSMPPYAYWHPGEVERPFKDSAAPVADHATPNGYEARLRHKLGHDVQVTVYDAPLIDATGAHSGWMSSLVDTTLQRQLETRQREQDEQLRQVQRRAVMEEMATTLAHEINQPLMVIGTNVESARLFSDAGNVPMLNASLEKIAQQKQRAANIIKTIREHSRIKTQGDEPCDLNAVVETVAAFLRTELKVRKARLTKSLASALPVVLADRVLLEQVLVNLVMNALQAMQGNPVDMRLLEIETCTRDDTVVVRVHDLGPGVAPEHAGRLFQSFFTTKTDGLGMGLSICRTIIENHGGQLEFENRSGRGATFSFSIPCSP